jgi:anthranilate synthase component II
MSFDSVLATAKPEMGFDSVPPSREALGMPPRVLVIDNYDSFVYNLVQYLGELGTEPLVYRNDAFTVADALALKPDAILLSPGPGRPEDAGILCDLIAAGAGNVPMFGVCLGHQAIGHVFGGNVIRAPHLMHGKTSFVEHQGVGVFTGLDSPLEATRYHSLIVERSSLPAELEVTAQTSEGIIMGMRHRTYDIEGVQFHPESILTTGGHAMLKNFLSVAAYRTGNVLYPLKRAAAVTPW